MLYGREGVYSMLFKVNVEACSCSKQNYCLAGVGYICMHACICTCTCTSGVAGYALFFLHASQLITWFPLSTSSYNYTCITTYIYIY